MKSRIGGCLTPLLLIVFLVVAWRWWPSVVAGTAPERGRIQKLVLVGSDANGAYADAVTGMEASFDASQLVVRLADGGRLVIPRERVAAVFFLPEP